MSLHHALMRTIGILHSESQCLDSRWTFMAGVVWVELSRKICGMFSCHVIRCRETAFNGFPFCSQTVCLGTIKLGKFSLCNLQMVCKKFMYTLVNNHTIQLIIRMHLKLQKNIIYIYVCMTSLHLFDYCTSIHHPTCFIFTSIIVAFLSWSKLFQTTHA